jgi:hypothetical protein
MMDHPEQAGDRRYLDRREPPDPKDRPVPVHELPPEGKDKLSGGLPARSGRNSAAIVSRSVEISLFLALWT